MHLSGVRPSVRSSVPAAKFAAMAQQEISVDCCIAHNGIGMRRPDTGSTTLSAYVLS